MMQSYRHRHCLVAVGVFLCAVAAGDARTGSANEPAIPGYRSYEELRRELEAIAGDEAATLQSLGTTLGGREIYVLTLSLGDAEQKPAILVVGSVHAPHLVGSELAVRMARRLVEGAGSDDKIRALLQEQTVYVISRPSPDASEAFFHKPYFERTGNARATDDDRDGRTNEDGPEDLNGDSQITMMRIEDPTGPYMPHPNDDRVLIEADAEKGEQGRYRLEVEGIDNDRDGLQAEDGPGGVALDRNFPFEYPYFETGAGPHQVSEPETRAIADFAFDHRNIYLVLSFSPHDNLMHPWKPGRQRGRIPTSVHEDDAPYLEHIASMYQDSRGVEEAPEPPEAQGSLVHWAYFHYGRWSLGTRGWWVPKMDAAAGPATEDDDEDDEEADDEDDGEDDGEDAADATDGADAKEGDRKQEADNQQNKESDEKRGVDDLNALRWLEQQGIAGFVPWKVFDHPDYPERRVEVGGFHPYRLLNPPAGELDKLAEEHTQFFVKLAGLRPRLAIAVEKPEDLGGGIYRVTAQVRNDGYLPTEPALGSRARTWQRLQMQIELPEGVSLVQGTRRRSLGRLAGHGGAEKSQWVVQLSEEAASKTMTVRAGSPATGTIETSIPLP